MAKIEQAGTKVHVPVMPKEVLSLLNISPSGVYVDGTIGIGGHSTLVQNQLSSQGHLIGVDRDGEAIKLCKKTLSSTSTRLTLFNDSYHHLDLFFSYCVALYTKKLKQLLMSHPHLLRLVGSKYYQKFFLVKFFH